ncbi:MAG: hypothetical protein WCP57_04730 [Bacteroidota bacterium]
MTQNQYQEPSYSQVFFKFLNNNKGAKIDIDSSYYNKVIKDNAICLLQSLYTKKQLCEINPKYIIDSLLNFNDTVSALVIIGLNPLAINNKTTNKLFYKLNKSSDKYTITHLYFALKMIERTDESLLNIRSKKIIKQLTQKLKEYANSNNIELDLYIETLAFLTEFDNVKGYQSEIKNVLELQNNDGGWSVRKTEIESNVHSTFLSLWFLLNVQL